MEISVAILSVGLLVFLAHLFGALFERTRVPDVLPLVFLGLLIGPVLGVVKVDAFGRVGDVLTAVALVVILFESGLGLRLETLLASMAMSARLTLLSFAGVVGVLTLAAVKVLGFSLGEGMLLGAILGGTSSAVVIPMVSRLRLSPSARTALLLESTFTDVLCIVVALGLLEALRVESVVPGPIVGRIIAAFLLASAIGSGAALFWSTVLKRIRRLENSKFTTPAFVFVVYGVTEILGYSGAIAALAFGVALGSLHRLDHRLLGRLLPRDMAGITEAEKSFFAEIVFLLKIFFFVYIGLSIRLGDGRLVLIGLLLTLALLAVRIPVVRMTMGRRLSKLDATIAAIMIPKGLAAAVLASLPVKEGVANGAVIQDVVYAVILFSIAATAVLSFLIEKNVLRQPYGIVFSGYAADAGHAAEAEDATGTGPAAGLAADAVTVVADVGAGRPSLKDGPGAG